MLGDPPCPYLCVMVHDKKSINTHEQPLETVGYRRHPFKPGVPVEDGTTAPLVNSVSLLGSAAPLHASNEVGGSKLPQYFSISVVYKFHLPCSLKL